MRSLMFAASVLLVGLGVAHGAHRETTVRDVTTITSPEGESRVLFRLDDADARGNTLIARAVLHFSVQGVTTSRRLGIRVCPVTTVWDRDTVEWDRGWSRPGGDFAESMYARTEIDLSRGPHESSIDLTVLVKEIQERGFEADGFILGVPPYQGEGLDLDDLARLAGLTNARLEIAYKRVPPPPPHAR